MTGRQQASEKTDQQAQQATLATLAKRIAQAAKILQQGGLVAFPTETVYGLGGDATNSHAVAQIFAVKKRPAFNPLIIHVSDAATARKYGLFNAVARQLAKQFWPGPLTLIVPRIADCAICELACAGLPSIALRVPTHPLAQDLLHAAGCPLAAPSANPSGRLSPTEAVHVSRHLPDIMTLDGGASTIGVESTIISCLSEQPVILRKGGITREAIEQAIGMPLIDNDTPFIDDTLFADSDAGDDADSDNDVDNSHIGTGNESQPTPLAPGQLLRHYAPQAKIRCNVTQPPDTDEALLAFGKPLPHHGLMINLSPDGDVLEAAANFFSALHRLDAQATKIAVMPIPNHGLGEALNDRLRHATASQRKEETGG